MVNNMEEFEKYFKTADLDRNGRISISEAISFFQKFGLPNTDLAKIWKYVDQEERGFLECTEFYNALKLVTLAQKGFSINPETVISQLYGSNSSQIPAPIIPSSQVGVGPKFEEEVNIESDWPRIFEKDIKIYTRIFEKIDRDKVGLISSEQAWTCFISWKLPIEVVNKVINLSDLDKDGILSLREFCIAVYLLARYKEGQIIPDFLPNSVLFDENLIRATGLPSSSYFNPKLESSSGLPNWAHEHATQTSIPFQKQYVNSPIQSSANGCFNHNLMNPSPSTSSNREWNIPQEPQPTHNFNPNHNYEQPTPYKTLNYDSNPNYNYEPTPHETINYSSLIHYPTVPTAPIEPLFTTQVRYPTIDLTHVDSGPNQTLESKTELNINKETIGTGTEEEIENRECVVCCERGRNCACLPCGHVATCYECMEMIKKSGGFCPICRGEIKQVVKIYTA